MRRILEDYEARLEAVNAPSKARGKIERERFSNGCEELSVRFRGLGVPDDTRVDAWIDDKQIGSIAVRSGAGQLRLTTKLGNDVPQVAPGQLATIRCEGSVLLRGMFRPD